MADVKAALARLEARGGWDEADLNDFAILESLVEQYNTALNLQLEARAQAIELKEQLRSREDALREVYELIAIGEPDNALHGLDAYLIREGIYRGEMASNPASEPDA